MSRMLTVTIVAGVWCLGVLNLAPSASGQAPEANRQPRPQNAALQVQNLDPKLEKILADWSQRSSQVQKLQGTHQRFVYEKVFQVEKRALGAFYYEAPGKGRIDLKPAPLPNGAQSGREGYKLQADRQERWICDGKDIWQVNDETKQVEVFPIPQENQGQNIMDGPMPFLFGMPPAKAKMRYNLKLLQDTPQQAVLEVHPRWQVDAANWKEAKVILDKSLYLPTAVQLIDPTGNLETVYTFGEFKVNKPDPNWFIQAFGGEKDPFHPSDLKAYKFVVNNPNQNNPNQNNPQAPGQVVPSVAGFGWKEAKALLEKLGCEVKIMSGKPAVDEKLSYVVYDQQPAAKTPLTAGMQVAVIVYDKAQPQPVAPAANPGTVPPVLGMYWKDAGAKLEQAGYKPKYLPGKAATDRDKVYMVYQQSPNAGQALRPGSEITLTVYNQVNDAPK